LNRFIPSKKVHVDNFTVAGWNDLAADKHEAARRAFLDWVSDGKPRTGYICELMNASNSKVANKCNTVKAEGFNREAL